MTTVTSQMPLRPAPRMASHGWIGVAVLGLSLFYFLGQVFAGTEIITAWWFTVAIVFGILATFAAGGLRSTFGLLNFILLAKFILFAILLKIILQEPSSENLHDASATSLVMALGFGGLFLGSVLFQWWPKPKRSIFPANNDARVFLAFSILLAVLGYGGFTLVFVQSLSGEVLQTGGILGVARAFSSVKAFSVVPAMLWAWRSGSKRFLTHPYVLSLSLIGFAVGVLGTGKEEVMEPIMFFGMMTLIRYGWRYKRLWVLGIAALLFYSAVVYPYSQYVRSAGGRSGGFSDRLHVIKNVWFGVTADEDIRGIIASHIDRFEARPYWNDPRLRPFNRFAMVQQADRLIFSTAEMNAYTGWETITWGFKLVLPSAIYPDKPIWGPGNFLGRIAGEIGRGDNETQVSYGVMANLFNAFGYPGVFFGSIAFFGCFYYWMGLFFGNPRWLSQPTASAMWLVLLLGVYHHALVEFSVAGLIASMSLPVVMLVTYHLAGLGARFVSSWVLSHGRGIGRLSSSPCETGVSPQIL